MRILWTFLALSKMKEDGKTGRQNEDMEEEKRRNKRRKEENYEA